MTFMNIYYVYFYNIYKVRGYLEKFKMADRFGSIPYFLA